MRSPPARLFSATSELPCFAVHDPPHGPNQHIGVGGDLHRLPAQPRAMILFISSIERDCLFVPLSRRPKTSEILPVGRAAVTSIRAVGKLVHGDLLAGAAHPDAQAHPCASVTWPLAVTVSVLMRQLPFRSCYLDQCKARNALPFKGTRKWCHRQAGSSSRRGLIFHVAARMAAVITPLITAAMGIASASAAVAAQPIEQKASAKVASRDEVWRRRNWLRLACTRNQSWIAVAETVATMTPSAVTIACSQRGKGQCGDQRREDGADRDQHHFDLGADDVARAAAARSRPGRRRPRPRSSARRGRRRAGRPPSRSRA